MIYDINEINKVYNELTVKRFVENPPHDKYKSWGCNGWVQCECSCGELVTLPLYGVKNEFIKSCGHLRTQAAVQTLNANRCSTHSEINLTYKDETHNIAEWSRITGIPRATIMYRLSKELPIEKILERKEKHEKNLAAT